MKTFKQHLITEATYKRFLKKNKNLSNDQIKELEKYFSRTNPKAGEYIGKEFDWQSKTVKNWTYDDFMKIKAMYKSGQKSMPSMKCKSIRIPGKEGVDYIRVKLKTNKFCAFIPLDYETAKYMNTRKFGVVSGDWCIGDSRCAIEWNNHIVSNEEVPVYVINKESKWVVMIQSDNKKWDVWDLDNDYKKIHIQIPGFDVRKNLLTPGLKKLYDELRDTVFSEEEEIIHEIPEEVQEAYDDFVNDVEQRKSKYERDIEEIYEENRQILSDTLKKYEEKYEKLSDVLTEFEIFKQDLESLLKDMERGLIDTDEKAEFEVNGHPVFIEPKKEVINEKIKQIDEKIESLEDEINVIEVDIDTIKNTDEYDLGRDDYDISIDWDGDPMNEESAYYEWFPTPNDGKYEDYFDWVVEYMGNIITKDFEEDVSLYYFGEYDHKYTGIEDLMGHHGLYDPEVYNE